MTSMGESTVVEQCAGGGGKNYKGNREGVV